MNTNDIYTVKAIELTEALKDVDRARMKVRNLVHQMTIIRVDGEEAYRRRYPSDPLVAESQNKDA